MAKGDPMTVLMERPGKYVRIERGEMPPVRRFALMVDRMPDPAQLRDLEPAALVLWDPGSGSVRLWLDWPAWSLTEAVVAGVRAVEATGLRVLRVDAHDWVTAGDVAQRIGKSRETVRLWAAGRMGPGGFPPPLNPGRDTTFYSWAEVLAWLRHRAGLDLPDEEPVLAAANLAVQLRTLMRRVPQAPALLRLLS
jgi:hypothetical protein